MFLIPAMMSRPACLARTVLPETMPWQVFIVFSGMVSVFVMNMVFPFDCCFSSV